MQDPRFFFYIFSIPHPPLQKKYNNQKRQKNEPDANCPSRDGRGQHFVCPEGLL
jgi:hypothetical protein